MEDKVREFLTISNIDGVGNDDGFIDGSGFGYSDGDGSEYGGGVGNLDGSGYGRGDGSGAYDGDDDGNGYGHSTNIGYLYADGNSDGDGFGFGDGDGFIDGTGNGNFHGGYGIAERTQLEQLCADDCGRGYFDGDHDGNGFGYAHFDGDFDGEGYGRSKGDGTLKGNGFGGGDNELWGNGASDFDGDLNGYGLGCGDFDGFIGGDGYGYGYGYGDGDGRLCGDGFGKSDGDGYPDGIGYGYGYSVGDGWNGIKKFNDDNVYNIDGIATIIKHIHGDIAKGFILNNDFTLTPSYIIKNHNLYAHGKTLSNAHENLNEKIYAQLNTSERIDEFIKAFDTEKSYPVAEFFKWHGLLTGSCQQGRESFARNHNIDLENDTMTVAEFIKLTKHEYGSDVILELKEQLNV